MRTFRRPIIPGYQFGGSGLAAMALLAIALSSKPRAPRQLSAEEIAEQDKRTERQRWNDEVAERKAAKQLAKRGYAK